MKHKPPLKWWDIKAQAAGVAVVYLYAFIGDDFWGDGSSKSARDFVAELDAIREPRIDVRINSPGGSFFDAMAIYNALVRHPAEVWTYTDGLAASGASIVAEAGVQRYMAENALFMIHRASACTCGNAEDHLGTAAILEKMDGSMVTIYAGKSGVDREAVEAAVTAETWYSADEALDAGLIDEVTEPVLEAEAMAAFDLSAFKHPPNLRPVQAAQEPDPDPASDTPVTLDPHTLEAARLLHSKPKEIRE